jgi:hypothetical protein
VEEQREESPTNIPSSTPSQEVSPTLIPTKPHLPTKSPSYTPIPTNIGNSNSTINFNLTSFQYPNATVVSSSDAKLELTSNDNPTTITNWYKEKINSTGMNTTSFVTTSTNGIVVNKLVGAGNGKEIRVNITTSSNGGTVSILIQIY